MKVPLKLKIQQMKSKNYPENIIKVFKKDGFILSEPDVLLDSEHIIQRSGENFRKSMNDVMEINANLRKAKIT